MKKSIIIALLSLIYSINLVSQEDLIKKFLLKNSRIIPKNITNVINMDDGIFSYDVFFLGENHSSESVAEKESLIIKCLNKNISNIFIEYPIGYNTVISTFINKLSSDTISEDFKFYSGGNKNQEFLLRYFYRENQERCDSLKYKLYHTDIIEVKDVDVNDFLWFYKKKCKTKYIKESFRYLKYIKNKNIKNEDSLLQIYLKIRTLLYNYQSEYNLYFNKYFKDFKDDLDGIYGYSLAKKEDLICGGCLSDEREMFMLNNILNIVKTDPSPSFISINGTYHTLLTPMKNFEGKNEWISLATRFKKMYPKSKVCSIYFMDKSSDTFMDLFYPTEKKLILENTKPGETYLIRLDGENSPFKELSEKFQYIVVW